MSKLQRTQKAKENALLEKVKARPNHHVTLKKDLPRHKVREAFPVIGRDKKGGAVILCPFCKPPHPITQSQPSACGTMLKVTAVQDVYKNVPCALCGKSDGLLYRVGESFAHIEPCTPGGKLYVTPPKLSKSAKFVFRFPPILHRAYVNLFLRIPIEVSQKVKDKEGKEKKVVVGYTWEKMRRTRKVKEKVL